MTFHKRSILSAQIRDEKTDLGALESPTERVTTFVCREVVIGSSRGVVLIPRFRRSIEEVARWQQGQVFSIHECSRGVR